MGTIKGGMRCRAVRKNKIIGNSREKTGTNEA